jgi:hypothetical protein
MRRLLTLSVLAAAIYPVAAHADTLATFTIAPATFTPNSVDPGPTGVASGTFTVDTTLGVFVSADMTFITDAATPVTYVFDGPATNSSFPNPNPLEFFGVVQDASGQDEISIELAVSTLVGYAGGPLCSVDTPCPNGTDSAIIFNPGPDGTLSVFTDGTAVADVAATPEPSSLVLLGTGALSLAGVVRRRLRKA